MPLWAQYLFKPKTLTSKDLLRRTLEIYALVLPPLTLPAGCHPFSTTRTSLNPYPPSQYRLDCPRWTGALTLRPLSLPVRHSSDLPFVSARL